MLHNVHVIKFLKIALKETKNLSHILHTPWITGTDTTRHYEIKLTVVLNASGKASLKRGGHSLHAWGGGGASWPPLPPPRQLAQGRKHLDPLAGHRSSLTNM